MVSLSMEEWKRKWADQFASGTLDYKKCVDTRGRLRGQVTLALNEATKFTTAVKTSVKDGKGVPNTKENLQITRRWITRIQENVEKLFFFNEKMKFFFSREEQVDTNNEWVITTQYCNYYAETFLATRENLYKILFFLIDNPDEERIMREVAKGRKNFAMTTVPDGELRAEHPDPSAADELALIGIDEAFHGFPDQDSDVNGGENDGGGDDEESYYDDAIDANATIIGAARGATGGDVQPPTASVASIWPFGTGTKNKTSAATAFPTSTTGDFFPGQNQNTMTTSTVKNPIQFANIHRTGEYELFNGPSIFTNAMGMGGKEPEENTRSPWEEIRLGSQQNSAPPSNVRPDNSGSNEAETLLQMFSNSLTSTFSARNIIREKWDGSPETFEKFAFAWTKCHFHMQAMRLSDAVKFSELLTCVTGTARLYLESLPSFLDSSYVVGLQKLYEVYSSRKTTLKQIVQKLTRLPQCQPTYESRLKLHAQISSYKASLESMKIGPQEVLLAFEIIFCENAFDPELKRQWVKYCERNRNINAPLGYDLTFKAMSDQVLKFVTEAYSLSGGNSPPSYAAQARKSPGAGQGGRRWLGNAAAASAVDSGQNLTGVKGQPTHQKSQGRKSGKKQTDGNKGGSKNSVAVAAVAAPFAAPRFKPQGQKSGGAGAGGNNKSLYKSGCPFCSRNNGGNGGGGGGNSASQQYAHKFNLGCPLIKLNVLSDQKIREIVKQRSLCTACLQPNHVARECPSPDYIRCTVPNCGQKHFRAFHPRSDQKKVTWGTVAAANEPQ